MKTFLALELLVASAISLATAASIVDPYKFAEGRPDDDGIVWWQQELPHTNWKHGALDSYVEGYFPKISDSKVNTACRVDWKHGRVHAMYDGSDSDSGLSGGFFWQPEGLSGFVSLQHVGVSLYLNVTITEQGQVLFNVNDKDVDWNQVLEAASLPPQPDYSQALPMAKDLGQGQDQLLAQAPPAAKGDGEGQ